MSQAGSALSVGGSRGSACERIAASIHPSKGVVNRLWQQTLAQGACSVVRMAARADHQVTSHPIRSRYNAYMAPERVNRQHDERLYQPSIHSRWIRKLHEISVETGESLTVLVDRAQREYVTHYDGSRSDQHELEMRTNNSDQRIHDGILPPLLHGWLVSLWREDRGTTNVPSSPTRPPVSGRPRTPSGPESGFHDTP